MFMILRPRVGNLASNRRWFGCFLPNDKPCLKFKVQHSHLGYTVHDPFSLIKKCLGELARGQIVAGPYIFFHEWGSTAIIFVAGGELDVFLVPVDAGEKGEDENKVKCCSLKLNNVQDIKIKITCTSLWHVLDVSSNIFNKSRSGLPGCTCVCPGISIGEVFSEVDPWACEQHVKHLAVQCKTTKGTHDER